MAFCQGEFQGLDDWLVVDLAGQAAESLETLTLKSDTDGHALPLRSRRVEADLNCVAGIVETKEAFIFYSDSDCSASFTFPIPGKSAVTSFEAVIGRNVLRTRTKPKAQAEEEFQDAVSQGHAAAQLQETASARLFKLCLGNLPANTECSLRIHYIQLLEKVGSILEYCHAATWVPPYNPHLQEPVPKATSKVTYSLSYRVRVQSSAMVQKLTSSTHSISTESDANGGLFCSITDEVSDAGKDFQLAVHLHSHPGSQLQIQTSKQGDEEVSTVLASFVPPKQQAKGAAQEREVVLVIDCSGSMRGDPIEQARTAASFFVRDLPFNQGVSFNIVIFGSTHQFMWPGCHRYDAQSQTAALDWITENVHANLGGTQIRATLEAIYKSPVLPGVERQIVFLTDGGISRHELEPILGLLSGNLPSETAKRSHVFCLGIGHGVHRPLLDAMADKSGGAAKYVMGSDNSDIANKVAWLSKAALSVGMLYRPRLVSHSCLLSISPSKLPAVLLPDTPLAVLATVKQREEGAALSLICTDAEGQEVKQKLELPAAATCPGSAFATLHAMSAISELMSGTSSLHLDHVGKPRDEEPSSDVIKEQVTKLACTHNLVTPFTSSIGVLLQQDPLDPAKVAQHEIPIQVPAGRTIFKDPAANAMLSRICAPMMARSCAAPESSMRCGASQPKRQSFLRSAVASLTGSGPSATPLFGSRVRAAAPTSAAAPRSAAPTSAAAPRSAETCNRQQGGLRGFSEAGKTGHPPGTFGAPPGAPAPQALSFAPQHYSQLTSPSEFLASAKAPASSFGVGVSKPSDGTEAPKDTRTWVAAASGMREVEGYWKQQPALFPMLFSKKAASSQGGPNSNGEGGKKDKEKLFSESQEASGMDGDQWATVLVLAWLLKYGQAERGLWGNMFDKAQRWLEAQTSAMALQQLSGQDMTTVIMAARKYV